MDLRSVKAHVQHAVLEFDKLHNKCTRCWGRGVMKCVLAGEGTCLTLFWILAFVCSDGDSHWSLVFRFCLAPAITKHVCWHAMSCVPVVSVSCGKARYLLASGSELMRWRGVFHWWALPRVRRRWRADCPAGSEVHALPGNLPRAVSHVLRLWPDVMHRQGLGGGGGSTA